MLDLYSKSKLIMQRGGFNLRKWNTNSTIVREAINRSTERVTSPSVSEGARSVTEEDESYAKATAGPPVNDDKTADSNIVKVLGSIWNIATNEFTFNLSDLAEQAKVLPTTKRSLLKILAKIFDPLGLLSPFTIQWKALFQVLCNQCTDWDEQFE